MFKPTGEPRYLKAGECGYDQCKVCRGFRFRDLVWAEEMHRGYDDGTCSRIESQKDTNLVACCDCGMVIFLKGAL